MKHVKTEDESITLFSDKFKEHYHSLTGALEEAEKKYIEPCKIKELAKTGKIVILDFCFGLGYNSLMGIYFALRENPDCKIKIIGLENDKRLFDEIKKIKLNVELEKFYKIIKELDKNDFCYKDDKIEITVIIGDARETVKKIDEEFDAVFFDPFSPKKCPELWTKEVFADVIKLMKKNAVLATYSCAKSVRDNMKKAGLKVEDGPVVKRWAPGTVGFRV